ncbi:MAG: thioredoxin family protein [Candidatus Micrarchaeales archaeon]|nr:thioredoxin family protein [Candidatus Micrarchaeales archaeon]
MQTFDSKSIDDVRSSNGTIVVLFYADWCPFCRAFKPVFESFDGKSGVSFGEARLNEDGNPMWDRFEIKIVPSVVAFKGGKAVARMDGRAGEGLSKKDLEAFLKRTL